MSSKYCGHLLDILWFGHPPHPRRATPHESTVSRPHVTHRAPRRPPHPAAQAASESNLAAGRPATASSHTDVYRPANVTDGDQATYWESAGNAFPQWIQVDLGATAALSRLVLKLPGGWPNRTQTLAVQTGTNGTTFTTVVPQTTYAVNPATTITLPAGTTARHVRLHITANSGWPAGQLSELEVWGTAPDTPQDGANLALGKPMTASSHTHTYAAANAGDDNLSTYWESAAYPATLTAQLGADATLTSVTLKLNPDAVWARRTQTLTVQGRVQGATAFTTLVPPRPPTPSTRPPATASRSR
ncbi:discoidin domain-containing protein [Nonomuraea salmonea]|uniref:discoidin domain-containing protein n=1 Tax=Nonomuraea salmonea TaxID=46181 RepID=UPI0031E5D474